jgi:hypothetical protein
MRWKIAAGFFVVASATAAAIAVAGGALGAGCSTPASDGSACGLDAGPDGASAASVTLTAFCIDLATAECTQAIVAACGVSTATCVQAGASSCVMQYSRPSSCNPGCLSYDAEYANDCIAAYQSVYASASLTAGDYQVLAAACLGVFNSGCLQATVCTSDTDCDIGAGLLCVVQGGTMGTCQVPSPGMAGDPCAGNPTAQCIDNTYCADAGKCAYDLGIDGGCIGGGKGCPRCDPVYAPCFYDVTVDASVGDGGETFDVNGLLCADGGVCMQKLPDDAACSDDSVCMGGFCVSGSCKTVYTFSPTTPPSTTTAPGCVSFGAH